MPKDKIIRILLLFSYILIATLLVFFIRPSYIVSIIFVYLPPSLVTFLWLKQSRKKILTFSLVSLLLFVIPVELMARLADVWDVASVFPRLFGTAPVENLVYGFFNIFFVLCFYEYFVDRDRGAKISRKWKYLVGMFIALSIATYTLYYVNSTIIRMNYWLIALSLLIPVVAIYAKKPDLLKKVLLPTVFFALVFFIHELISMSLGHWWWPGEYIFTIDLVGETFPLDDAAIWYILSTPMLIGGYEFFMDDFE